MMRWRARSPGGPHRDVGVTDTPEGLSAIHHPGLRRGDLATAARLPSFQSWIDASRTLSNCRKARVILRPGDACATPRWRSICEICGTPGMRRARPIAGRRRRGLASIFAGLTDGGALSPVRFDVSSTTTDACRQVPYRHRDHVTLVCTYRGTGTQYGFAGAAATPSVFSPCRPAHRSCCAGTRLASERPAPASCTVRRPIEGTGETRLVLVLDPIMRPEEARPGPELTRDQVARD